MDEVIDELKERGLFTPDEMRWAEYLRAYEAGEMDDDGGLLHISEIPMEPDEFKIDPKLSWRQNYENYLQSEQWWRKRGITILKAGNRCQRCGWLSPRYDGLGLEVHHKTYKHLGNEPWEDLEALCKPCHEIADQERAARNRRGG